MKKSHKKSDRIDSRSPDDLVKALQQQRDMLKSIIESLTHPFFVVNVEDLSIVAANSAASEMAANFEGIKCYAILRGDHKRCGTKDHPCPVDSVTKTKKPAVIEHTYYDEKGDERYIEVHSYPVFNNEGEVTQVIEYWLDVTQRKKATDLLRQSEERYSLAQRVANIGSWEWDITSGELSWSEQVEPMFGFEPGQFKGIYEAFLDCIHPDDRQSVEKSAQEALFGEKIYRIKHRIVRPDKSVRWVSETGAVIRDENNKPVRMVGLVQDVTERELAEQEVESLAKFPAEDPNPVIRIAADGIVLYTNTAGKNLLDDWDCRIGEEVPARWRQYVTRILKSGKREKLEITVGQNSYDLIITPITKGQYVNVYGSDTTERNQIEEALREYREHLEELVQERTEELTKANKRLLQEIEQRKKLEREILNISEREQRRIGQELHDSLGQQLTGISFMTRAVEQKLEQNGVPQADDIAKVLKLVNDATDQARGLAKGLHPVDLNSGSLISSLHELASSTQKLFGIRCEFGYDRKFEIKETEIAVHLYRIAQEAVTNAIKHGRTKNINIKFFYDGKKGVLAVENDGRDFPKEFEKRGTGMGLQIMDHRVDLIGGDLVVQKGPKGGTVVTCTFPYDQV